MLNRLDQCSHLYIYNNNNVFLCSILPYWSEKYRHRLSFSCLPLNTQKISEIQLDLGFDALLESRSGVNISPVDLNIDLHVSVSAVVDLSAVAPLSVIWDKYKRVNNKIKFIEFDTEHDTLDSAILSTIPHKV